MLSKEKREKEWHASGTHFHWTFRLCFTVAVDDFFCEVTISVQTIINLQKGK
jgi:hypothetical protein